MNKLTYDQVLRDTLFLPMDDIERLIERLTAERDGLYAGVLPPSEHPRPFGREMAARLNYNLRNNVDTDRRIKPEGGAAK